ncbi:hypothetical protein AMJ39_03035 [candidate division TA06 bacterium DG_24]|uniref:Uncharacterized protein n=1 Tax=candidate division TA06 bacterium DG_24 TaxID=1703770 RepID=A0A0S7WW93_UNCT6|nr:MAG: hypothetical protein AMJ39_03035 [candidate division TA06 bacterium DG_24]
MNDAVTAQGPHAALQRLGIGQASIHFMMNRAGWGKESRYRLFFPFPEAWAKADVALQTRS